MRANGGRRTIMGLLEGRASNTFNIATKGAFVSGKWMGRRQPCHRLKIRGFGSRE